MKMQSLFKIYSEFQDGDNRTLIQAQSSSKQRAAQVAYPWSQPRVGTTFPNILFLYQVEWFIC